MTIAHMAERLGRIKPAPPIRNCMDALAHMLLKALLYAGVMLGAIVLDMHYDSVLPADVCIDNTGPGHWDCQLARRVGPSELDTLNAVGTGLLWW